jgi:hypothetical protein
MDGSGSMARTILILSSTPRDMAPLRVHEEVREIEDAVRRARRRDEYQVVVRLGVRARDVHRALLEHRPAIVHFAGHGRGELGVVLEDDSGDALVVSGSDLAHVLGLFAHEIECVLLNACHSEAQIDSIARHIRYVIGMYQGLHDRAAVTFAGAFYEALASGESVPFAYELACGAVSVNGLGVDQVAALASAARPDEEARRPSAPDVPAGRGMRPWRRRLGVALSPVILLGLTLWLGAAVHDARLMLIGLSGTELSYPGAELLGAGLGAGARMVWYALAGPLAGVGVEGWGVLPLIALAGTAVALARRARSGLLLSWLAILLLVFALGTLFYVHAVGVHHVVKPGLGAEWPCRLGPSLPEQIRFEVCSWLSNDSLVNERRRMALAGLWMWFAAALALATWLSWNTIRRARSQRYLGWYRVAGGGLAAAHGLLLVSLLVQAPRAYAIAYWGLRYPRVTTVEPACDPALAEAVAAGTCRVLSVGHEADGDLVILHGAGCPGAAPSPDEHGERAAPAETIRSVHLENRQPMRSGERCVRHTEGTELIPNRG